MVCWDWLNTVSGVVSCIVQAIKSLVFLHAVYQRSVGLAVIGCRTVKARNLVWEVGTTVSRPEIDSESD